MPKYIKINFDQSYGNHVKEFVEPLFKGAFKIKGVCSFASQKDFDAELDELVMGGKTPVAFLRLDKELLNVDLLYVHIQSAESLIFETPFSLIDDLNIDALDILGSDDRRLSL